MATGQRRTAERIQVGATLKRMRQEAELGREAAAEKLGCTTTTIGNLEQGRTKVSHGDLAALLELYGAPQDQVDDLLAVNREAHRGVKRIPGGTDIQPHQRRAADLIRAAEEIDYYSPEVFIGILQHPDYARAAIAPNGHLTEVLENRLRFRLDLAGLLTREKEPLKLWAVLGEAALHRNVGGPAVMRRQLLHVAELCRSQPNLTVQIVPFEAREHYFMGATLTIYRFDGTISPIASVDSTVGEYFFERDATVVEARGNFDDLRTKALDPLTSVDRIERAAAEREHR